MVFDDKRVEPYNIDDLEKDCFGGKFVPEAFDNGMKPMQEFDRPNSAYMLLYERSTPVSVSEASGCSFFVTREEVALWGGARKDLWVEARRNL